MAKREQPACGLVRCHRPPPLLDQLDEPVGRVEAQLHRRIVIEHTFVSKTRLLMRPRGLPGANIARRSASVRMSGSFCDSNGEGMDFVRRSVFLGAMVVL